MSIFDCKACPVHEKRIQDLQNQLEDTRRERDSFKEILLRITNLQRAAPSPPRESVPVGAVETVGERRHRMELAARRRATPKPQGFKEIDELEKELEAK